MPPQARPQTDRLGSAPAKGTACAWLVALAGLPPTLVGLAIVWLPYLPNHAGKIGADYSVWLPDLLAGTYWHLRNGLFSVPWFNPAQCGGVPLQADPQGAFFSLTQILAFFVPPVRALQVSLFAYAAAGYLGSFCLARRFGLGTAAAVLASVLFALNSFFGARLVVGHLGFAPFMLLPAAAACLLGPASARTRPWSGWILRCGGFALVLGLMTEGGMLVLLPPCTLSLLMVIALHAIVMRTSAAMPLLRLAFGMLLGLLLSAGKLAAVLSLMAHIPRDAYKLPGYLNAGETLWIALRALFVGPAGDMQTHLANASVLFERHEFEYGIGPAAFALLATHAFVCWRRRIWPARPQRLATDLLLLLLLIPIAVNTYGDAWTGFLKTLPVIRNSSSLLRWFAAYILPASLAAGLALDRLPLGQRLRWPASGAAGAITLAALLLSDHGVYGPDAIGAYDPAPIENAWRTAEATGQVPPVTDIAVLKDQAGRIDRTSLLRQNGMAQGQSQLFCYDPLFGYRLETFIQGTLHPGSVFERTQTPAGPVLNLKNPACYVFPQANSCKPGDPFATADIDQARRFVSYTPFSWRKPIWARAADWAGYILWPTTILALIATLSIRIIARHPRQA
jgi:hypothetical protein